MCRVSAVASLCILLCVSGPVWSGQKDELETDNFRKPASDADLRYWLENMVWHHRYSNAEITAATGLSADEIEKATKRFGISPDTKPKRSLTRRRNCSSCRSARTARPSSWRSSPT